ncbi:hypothetical protein DICVIV_10714 [Dictyocaulus viviparus]|uniref:Reduced folate carrier n=1 Tax=Dictyocaulus viviparus TaxID=29172 RepID=A0A0D8XHS5_DICVI|nr:hypothetical protein DICVIV_10714 [Dictyocaulus viviparus]
MRWQATTALLCTYGFLKEFRPLEPYLYEYEHRTLNISEHVLNAQRSSDNMKVCQVYPLWTYSYMFFLIPVFLITDIVLYKPLIIFESLSYITIWIIFVFFGSVLSQQIVEVIFGLATGSEIAYFAYIYAMVSKEEFKRS